MTDFSPGAQPHRYWLVGSDAAEPVDGGVIDEVYLTIYVNLQEIATIMCSPVDEDMLALGFLYNEGVIDRIEDIGLLQLNVTRTLADVFIPGKEVRPPRRFTITSGCGGGVTLQDIAEEQPPLDSSFTTTTETILARVPELQAAAVLYNQVRGVHTAVLADESGPLLSAEDVGRHNTIDKIAGMALHHGISTTDRIMLASGRVSSEMTGKARRMGIPIIVSRTAPTALSVQLAELWGICLIGYARRGTFRVYTHPWRVGLTSDV